ncbi:MAG: hypothetical protein HDQ89_00080 [Desulfovibrio sp.]|nr:hypothetical protein [Desulfovibrio sp.]
MSRTEARAAATLHAARSTLFRRLRRLSLFQWLLVVTVVYLLWQVSLSGAILTAQSVEQSDRLSELARRTVGFGTALFVFRAAYRRFGWKLVLPVALVAGWSAMWAEDALVNHFADESSAQARLEAKTIQLFTAAMARGKVTLPELPEAIASAPLKVRAFSRVLGFAIWNDPALVRQITARTDAVLAAIYGQELYDKADAGYDRYLAAWVAGAEKRKAAAEALARINFAQYARDLNGQLGPYAACTTEDCRRKISNRVNNYIRRNLPELGLELDLEAFCREEREPVRYVMGRAVTGAARRVCTTNEKDLYAWLRGRLGGAGGADTPELADLPAAVRTRILSGDFLSLEAWRELWKTHIEGELSARRQREFGDDAQYADGAPLEKEGKAFAISVFLPPVALGFSVTVCFLHLASLGAALTRRPGLCALVAAVCYVLPAFFATPVPLSGFAGIYARWLVFWEGALYPLGVLRWLMT